MTSGKPITAGKDFKDVKARQELCKIKKVVIMDFCSLSVHRLFIFT